MNKRKWLAIVMAALVFNSCAMSTAQKNKEQMENSKVVIVVGETPTVIDSKSVTNGNSTVAEKQINTARENNCVPEIKGASNKHIEIPKELCFDEKKPADKSEVVRDPPRGTKQANTFMT